MGRFDRHGSYRFIYTDHSGQETMLYVDARNDADAISFARRVQHGLEVEIWRGPDRVAKLEPPRDIDAHWQFGIGQESVKSAPLLPGD